MEEISPDAEDSGGEEAEAIHLDKMGSSISPSAHQGTSGNVPQTPRDTFEDRIDELEQRLAALTAGASPSRSSNASFTTAPEHMSPKPLSQNALGKRREERSPTRPDPVLVPSQRHTRQGPTTTRRSSRPTTSHQASTRPSTRRSSTAPTSQVPSASSSKREGRAPTSTRPSASSSKRGATGPELQATSASSSRRSSPKANQPASAQSSRPTRRHHRNNSTWPPPTVIPDGRQALQSVRAFSGLRADVLTGMRAESRLQSSSLPTLPRPTTAASSTSTANLASPDYDNHIPAANIDWTRPSTRRAEYEQIDKARRGLRGALRRVVPRSWRKDARIGFHDDGAGSDAGTVRRFRMDVAEGEGGADGSGKKSWWKFGKNKGKVKGKASAEGTHSGS